MSQLIIQYKLLIFLNCGLGGERYGGTILYPKMTSHHVKLLRVLHHSLETTANFWVLEKCHRENFYSWVGAESRAPRLCICTCCSCVCFLVRPHYGPETRTTSERGPLWLMAWSTRQEVLRVKWHMGRAATGPRYRGQQRSTKRR